MKIAKFPSRKDSGDVELWEHISHVLAKKAGINVPETRVVKVGSEYHTLLSKRYDRTDDGRRIHYASALTMLGLKDGTGADEGYGYLDIVDFIIRGCTDVEKNIRELYRRVAFNICIGNSADHFRNHGFLLTAKGWILSPAFDLNPTLNRYQGIMISRDTNEADLTALLNASEDYFIPREEAWEIIKSVKEALKDWQKVAKRLGAQERDINLFSQRFITE
jgi:serine/threonine-protein kinase HipA